jgi:hypothetical protein
MSQGAVATRPWVENDDEALRNLMRRQMQADSMWPPAYARCRDPAQWLGQPADLGRWVAVDLQARVVGHVGLGSIRLGPVADLLRPALPCGLERVAEICRLVVDPQARLYGLASLLTRRGLRSAIEAGRVATANVLTNRGSWLDMMQRTGWQYVGETSASTGTETLVVLLAPIRFVRLALSSTEKP